MCTCNDIRNKKNMSSRSYILQVMLWHQSHKSIHYRISLIFQNKKNNRFEGQNMGGNKRHVNPPPLCQNMGVDISPLSPPGFTPLVRTYFMDVFIMTYVKNMKMKMKRTETNTMFTKIKVVPEEKWQ